MKMFWEVLGVNKKLYTGKAVEYIIDNRNGKKYFLGTGRFYKKQEYPINLAENIWEHSKNRPRYEFFYNLPWHLEPDKIEKNGFFRKKRKVYSTFNSRELEKEYLGILGFWKIDGLDLYTGKAADYIRDKKTGIEYRRGEMELFSEENFPFPLIEHTDLYEYIYETNEACSLTQEDYLREINAVLTTKLIFNKK
jgi:hypothetical protein